MNHHRFVWHDLNTTDVEGAQRFYGEVFGWKFDHGASAHSFWLPYVAVDHADRASELAAKLGGKVMVSPTDIPNVGRFACWSDPQQAAIAVLAPAMK